jgi:PTH1 family peptidyl-tRNA hydrolase
VTSVQRDTYLIIGLGNPGLRYTHNRHNVGFHCLRRLAADHGLEFSRKKKRARIASGSISGRKVVLAMPQTFMNESGRSVAPLARFFKVPPDHMMVIYDDLDLPSAAMRIRPGGGSGGHKGLRSIIQHLGTQDFNRLRIGIGRPPGRMDPADYVLQDLTSDEQLDFDATFDQAVAAIETWLTEGIEASMTAFNRSPGEPVHSNPE